MSFPNKHRVKFIYWFCTQLTRFAMYLESSLWGYSWCKTCKGCKVYPNSGYYSQPDGWRLCPDCRGHRWFHISLTRASQYPDSCHCRGKSKGLRPIIYLGNTICKIQCPGCKRIVRAKKKWIAMLKWNGTYYYTKENVKFLKDTVYEVKKDE